MTPQIEFVESHGVHTGADPAGRSWRISRCYTGWRLEFTDTGDAATTNAGVHATLEAAKHEANRAIGRGGARPPSGR